MKGHPPPAALLVVTLLTIVSAILLELYGCAHVAAPSGGPPDTVPPYVVSTEPANLTVIPGYEDKVRFLFSESISERNIRRAVTLFPWEERPDVDKGGDDLKIEPREGWVPDRIYHIVIEPVVQDLFNNQITERIRFIFSTGAPLPENRVHGSIVDRITGGPAPPGRTDLLWLPDSLRYGVAGDSAGNFSLEKLPPGEYLAIGYEDVNQNRRADPLERADSQRVTLGSADSVELELAFFHHDTVGPVLARAEPVDSMTLELEFDLYLDPDAPLPASNIRIRSATGERVGVDTVLHEWAYTRWRQQRAVEAAAAAAADTLPADTLPADTLAQDTLDLPADTVPAPERGRAVPTDTLPVSEPEPLPGQKVRVVTVEPIPPGSYTLQIQDVRGLSGIPGGGEADFEVPEPPPEPEETPEVPPDSVPPDSVPPDSVPPGSVLPGSAPPASASPNSVSTDPNRSAARSSKAFRP